MQFDFKEKAKKRQDRNSPIKPLFCIQFENPSKVSWGEFQISMGFVQPPRSAPIFDSPHESLVTRNIACDISGILTKAPCEAPAMHGRHVYKGIADSVLHTFVLLSGMRAELFRLCYARSMPLLFAPRSASRSWVCCSHYRLTSRLWACRMHCRSASRS